MMIPDNNWHQNRDYRNNHSHYPLSGSGVFMMFTDDTMINPDDYMMFTDIFYDDP